MINKLGKERVQHSLLTKFFHWLFVFIFGYGVLKQIESKEQLSNSLLLKSEMIFATIFLVFIILRFIHMNRTYKTSLPVETPSIHLLAAKLVHISMYICLSGIAVSGLGIGFIFWLGYVNGYFIQLFIWVHEIFFLTSIWLISIHIAAAIYHRIRYDFVWSSMVPFLKEKVK